MNTVDCVTEEPGGYRHRLTVGGHELRADLTREEGGQDAGPDAHEYFDASLAACKALTAMWFAKRHGIPLERVRAEVERDDSEERKGKYKLTVRLAYDGALDDEQKKRLDAAAAKCP